MSSGRPLDYFFLLFFFLLILFKEKKPSINSSVVFFFFNISRILKGHVAFLLIIDCLRLRLIHLMETNSCKLYQLKTNLYYKCVTHVFQAHNKTYCDCYRGEKGKRNDIVESHTAWFYVIKKLYWQHWAMLTRTCLCVCALLSANYCFIISCEWWTMDAPILLHQLTSGTSSGMWLPK